MRPSDHYTLITADSHAGGSHAQYRDYLEPEFLDDFDAWRGKYKNPFRDLRDTSERVRNWDSERRWSDMESDGVVAEVLFPNTIPPFFPSFVLFAPPPRDGDEYRHRLAGIRAHNRWLVDFVAECPERRAGIGQIFVNDLDDAIADARWIKEHGLRGGVLLPNFAPDITWLRPYFDPSYDPLWAALEDLDMPVNLHGGTGSPDYGDLHGTGALVQLAEASFFSQRPLVHLLLGGVFERFPRLKVVMTELGCHWVPQWLRQLDGIVSRLRGGVTGELRFAEGTVTTAAAERVLRPQLLARREPAPGSRCRGSKAAAGRSVHVGQRLPPRRGHLPVHPRDAPPGLPRRPGARDAGDSGRQRRCPVRLRSCGFGPLRGCNSARLWPSCPRRSRSCPRTRIKRFASPRPADPSPRG